MNLCCIGYDKNNGNLSSAAFWFSTVQPIITLAYPSPQSSGSELWNRSIRFVNIKKVRFERCLIIDQISGRHLSDSSMKKSLIKHVTTVFPFGTTYLLLDDFRTGLLKSEMFFVLILLRRSIWYIIHNLLSKNNLEVDGDKGAVRDHWKASCLSSWACEGSLRLCVATGLRLVLSNCWIEF